jgi:hypothetical protein
MYAIERAAPGVWFDDGVTEVVGYLAGGRN